MVLMHSMALSPWETVPQLVNHLLHLMEPRCSLCFKKEMPDTIPNPEPGDPVHTLLCVNVIILCVCTQSDYQYLVDFV